LQLRCDSLKLTAIHADYKVSFTFTPFLNATLNLLTCFQ